MNRREFLGVKEASATAAFATRPSQQTTSTVTVDNQLLGISGSAPIRENERATPGHRELDVPECVAAASNRVRTVEPFRPEALDGTDVAAGIVARPGGLHAPKRD